MSSASSSNSSLSCSTSPPTAARTTTACSHVSAERSQISRSTKLIRVSITVDAARVELAIAAWELVGVHNSSVEYLFDPLAEPTEEPWPGHDHRPPHDSPAEVAAYLSAERWRELESAARIAAADFLGSERMFHVKHLPVRDWRTAWHDHFSLIRIPTTSDHSRATSPHSRLTLRHSRAGGNPASRTVIVRPPHIAYDPNPDEIVIDLAPGLAFGTGQHQSTRLCLRLLAEQITGGERVLDVGTGSGVLAVAAARLGAASVLATDIDPLAVDAARQTVRQNQLGDQVEVIEGSIPAGGRFDLVVANLTADLLQFLAQDLANALEPGGRLIASGLIASRQEEVVSAFADRELRLLADRSENQWRGLLFCSTESE